MKLIRDLSGEGKARFGFVSYFVKIWVENLVYVLCKEQRVDKYILASFPGFPSLCNKKANLYLILGCFGKERKKGKTGGVGGPEGCHPF